MVKISLGDLLKNKNERKEHLNTLDKLGKAEFGTKFHKTMQVLNQNPDFDIYKFFDSKDDIEKIKSSLEFLKNLKNPPFMKILKSGISEWSFVTKIKGHVFEGRVDLFSIIDDVAWVLDYKTGKQSESDLKQLSIYSKAVSDVYKKEGQDCGHLSYRSKGFGERFKIYRKHLKLLRE